MSDIGAGWLQFGLLFAALAVCYVPLGNYIARILGGSGPSGSGVSPEGGVSPLDSSSTADKDWAVERGFYRLIGINRDADQKWSVYVRSILAFSAVSVLFLYGLQRLQHYLPLSQGFPGVTPDTAWNTAASFVTNTNWQNYAGEATMGTSPR
jgi:K+-transporting ATPase ATPase A chain